MEKIYNMSKDEREELGKLGREHVMKNYSYDQFSEKWDKVLSDVVNKKGSWSNRKGYKSWELIEV